MAGFLQACSGKSPNTVNTYRCALTAYLKFNRSAHVGAIEYDRFIQYMRNRGRGQNGITLYASVLRRYAEFIDVPTTKWQVPRSRMPPRDTLAPHELDLLRGAAARTRDSAGGEFLVTFLSETGLRRAEFLALRWTDVDLVSRQITVRAGKGGDSRLVPLTGLAWAATMKFARAKIGSDTTAETARLTAEYVWPARDPSGLVQRIKALASLAGLEVRGVHPHMFRHTFATLSRQAGINEKWLQRLMGHKSLATTDRYGTVDMDKAFEKMRGLSLGSAPAAPP